MPATLRVGSKVSSNRSAHGAWLELGEGEKRRRKARLFGVVVKSTEGGKWEVRWDSGVMEAMFPGVLKFEGGPDEDSLSLVRQTMGVRR